MDPIFDTANNTVTISTKEYSELIHDQKFLYALQGAGVDNWDGYDFACEAFGESTT